MAKGWRPPTSGDFPDLERKATILGGILTLKTLGIEPWASAALPPEPLKLQGDPSGPFLVSQVKLAAQKEGKTAPVDRPAATAYVRDRVIAAEAGGAAWVARAMYLTLAGGTATDKRAKVESAVSTGVGLTAKGLYIAAGSATGTIVGAPVGAVLGIVGGVMDGVSIGLTVLSGRSQIESARSDGEAAQYATEFQNELDLRSLHVQQDLIDQQIEIAKQIRDFEVEAANVQGAQITRAITATVWVGVLGGTGLLAYTVLKAVRHRRMTHQQRITT